MKTITAKEFQLKHATVLKNVAQGDEYEVTFHRKPLVKLSPIGKQPAKRSTPGSKAAFLQSLQHTVESTGDLHDLPYKQLHRRMLDQKYGQ